jgi:CubicO group peptidase (beta-lactamase class C family)
MLRGYVFAFLALLSTPHAAHAETPEAYTQLLAEWVTKHKIKRAVLVVRREGRVVHRAAIGGADVDGAYHLASLSKAITGACVATLIRDGKLKLSTPLSTALVKFFKANGRPEDRRIERVTVAQLLTHRAGFASAEDDGNDAATGSILRDYLKDHSPRQLAGPQYLARVLATKLAREPGEKFAYSNGGYLALGAIVEEATGRPYEEYCRDAVLTPAGASGSLEPTWRVMAAYGGWRMAGADYLAFYDTFDLQTGKLTPEVRQWMLDRTGKTFDTSRIPAWYGLGVRVRDAGRGIEVWHTGSWLRAMPRDEEGPLSANTSAFALRLADGTSFFVHSTPLLLGGVRPELHQGLIRVHQTVKWK